MAFSRYTPLMSRRQLKFMPEEQFLERGHISYDEHDEWNFSNFMNADWLSSSANSCEEDAHERYFS